jgi:hypothetical protein
MQGSGEGWRHPPPAGVPPCITTPHAAAYLYQNAGCAHPKPLARSLAMMVFDPRGARRASVCSQAAGVTMPAYANLTPNHNSFGWDRAWPRT